MNNVKIKFIGLGYLDTYQANISIYDKYNKLIYKGQTYNGKINLSLKPNKAYKLVATQNNNILSIVFYVDICSYYVLNFNNNIITLKLKDYYYNLPIERGEIILWEKA